MTVIVFLTLAELAFFLVHDSRVTRGTLTQGYFIRLISSVGGMALIVSEWALSSMDMHKLTVDFSFAVAVLVMYPCSFEKPAASLMVSVCLMLMAFVSMLYFDLKPPGNFAFKCQRESLSFVAMLLLILSYYLHVACMRFSGIRAMFRNMAVWYNVEDYSRFMYSIVFLVASMIFLCGLPASGCWQDAVELVSLFLYLFLYAMLFLRAVSGRTYMLRRITENRIKDIIKGNLRTAYIDKVEEDMRMNNLYKRVVMYMEEKRPYLNQSFDMTKLAEKLFTNKLYLSRTINILSGRNFRQFVNYYRVQRALELFKQDPKLKIGEVAEMCGFHSSVTFNMSFKVNTGKTPTEWLHEYVTGPMIGKDV